MYLFPYTYLNADKKSKLIMILVIIATVIKPKIDVIK